VASGWPAVRETCRSIGIEFDPWQADLNTCILAKDSSGMLAADTVVMSIPRQVGKTFDVGAIVFAVCIANPGTTVVWTAHRFKVARETFDALRAMAKSPLLAPHIDYDAITTGAGNETIPFRNGSRMVFAARERGTVRGFSKVRLLVLDEGQILTEQALADMAPTMNQAHDPQILIMGTPPKPTDPSEVFSGLRARALAGESEGVLYVEFGAEPGSDLDDRVAWRRANPSFPKRTPERAVLRLRKLLSDDDFAREALGIWETQSRHGVVDADLWFGLRDAGSQADTRSVVFAADIAPDRQSGSIALAGERPDGRVHVEVIVPETAGTAWMGPWLAERAKRYRAAVVLDAGAPAGALIPELQKAGVEPVLMTTRDVGQACGMFYDATLEDRLRHLDDPRLNTALAAGRKRDIGVNGLWAWHRRDTSTDLTQLVAATNAVWGFLARRPEPTRKRALGRSRSY
jgi:phage terminase large subunit-like protein